MSTGTQEITLSRSAVHARAVAPVRHVHLGLGNFFRAHQAVYSDRATDAEEWGIAAFTGRSNALADAMTAQQGLYTLITRASDGPTFDVIASVSRAHSARDHGWWLHYLRSPECRLLTLTVTEAAYLRNPTGALDHNHPAILADITALKDDPTAPVTTIAGRLVAGFAARHTADAGPISLVPCDNLTHNGTAILQIVTDMAERIDPVLASWIDHSVSPVNSMVDRITPRTSEDDRMAVLAQTGLLDTCPVVTEPFSEWILQGVFPVGRPRWEDAGARTVDDVTPFEQRKLWLLNGAHSLLAYAGSIRGHQTVAAATADDVCLSWVNQWWDEAARHLELPADEIAAYRQALVERFTNAAIGHRLDQIAADGSQKLPVRAIPVLTLERREGRLPLGTTRLLAAWILHLRGMGSPVDDSRSDEVVGLAAGRLGEAVRRVLTFLDPETGSDTAVIMAVISQAEELART